MWDYVINIHSSKLLCTKIKESRINKHKNISKINNLHFVPNNIFTRFFKKLIYIYIYILSIFMHMHGIPS